MSPEEKAAYREAAIKRMVEKGHTRERAEELIGTITKALFGPGGRFGQQTTRDAAVAVEEEA